MSKIIKIEIHEFSHKVKNLGVLTNANTIGAVGFSRGEETKLDKYAVVVTTADGGRGEYVTHWGGNSAACAVYRTAAPSSCDQETRSRSGRGVGAHPRLRLCILSWFCYAEAAINYGPSEACDGLSAATISS